MPSTSDTATNTQPKTTANHVAGHLRTPEEMAAYLDAWLEEAPEDAAGIARALGDIARAEGRSPTRVGSSWPAIGGDAVAHTRGRQRSGTQSQKPGSSYRVLE